jgi:aspartate kinase
MKKISVCKFGGSSTACWNDVERKKKIIEDDITRKVIVVSAHGKAYDLDKDTNLLIDIANKKDIKKANFLIGKARRIYPYLEEKIFDKLEDILLDRINNESLRTDSPAAYEASIKSFGEELCAKLHSKALGWEYVDPSELFVFDGDFDNAKILPESKGMIRERLSGDKIFVVPGYFGYNKDGLIATLKRGGSDLTGSYIASSLDAIIYENFTDTNGIAVASPKIIKDPKIIEEMTYEEIRSLAYSGFSVLYEEAMMPVAEKGIPIHVRSTFDYPKKGTMIVENRKLKDEKAIVGVAYKPGLVAIDIDCFGLNDQIGIGEKILGQFRENNLSVEYITTGIDDMSIIFKKDQYLDKNPDRIKNIEEITPRVKSVVSNGYVSFQDNLGAVVVAGKGLKGNRGIAAKIQKCLADNKINLRFISQGPSERCIVYGVEEKDGETAVRAIYKNFLK